jgi:penicillin-insensitive murein endopeptidase
MLARNIRTAGAVVVALAATGCGSPARPAAAPRAVASRPGALAAKAPSRPTTHAAATLRHEAAPAEPDEPDDVDDNGDEGAVDDSFDFEPPPDATIAPPHPLASVSAAELERRLVSRPASLGPMSIGKPSAGLLFNAVAMPQGDAWTIVAPGQAFGTEETTRYLDTAIHAVAARFPETPKLAIGDISAKAGGYLSPHLSHQSGRDVDISYYYVDGVRWYRRADAQNLDAPRTWAFVRALVTLTDVDLLLIDHSIQKLLRAEAERVGEDAGWLDSLFKGKGNLPPIIRHAPGHATHLHIRFYSPIAQETGRRAYGPLLAHGMIHAGAAYAVHVARKGDTLAELAKRYHTTVRSIRRANGLKSNLIQARKSYRIPQSGRAPPSLISSPVAIPPRRLPPAGSGVP